MSSDSLSFMKKFQNTGIVLKICSSFTSEPGRLARVGQKVGKTTSLRTFYLYVRFKLQTILKPKDKTRS